MQQIKARIIDLTHLELDQPVDGSPGETITISIVTEKDKTADDQKKKALQNEDLADKLLDRYSYVFDELAKK